MFCNIFSFQAKRVNCSKTKSQYFFILPFVVGVMSLSKEDYYLKADALLQQSKPNLQALFRVRWKEMTGLEWREKHSSRYISKIGKEIYNDATNLQKKLIQEGKVEQWDVPLLVKSLLSFRKGSVMAPEKEKRKQEEDEAIRSFGNLWFKVGRNKGKKLSVPEYQDFEVTFQACMISLGAPADVIASSITTGETPRSSSSVSSSRKKKSKREPPIWTAAKLPNYLMTPQRVALVKHHRAFVGHLNRPEMFSIQHSPGAYKLTVDPNDEHQLPERCEGKYPIQIRPMEMELKWSFLLGDRKHFNCIVHLTLIEDPLFMGDDNGIHQIGQDEDGNVTRLSLYQVERDEETRKAMQFGRKVAVIHPWMLWNFDGGYGLRVDEPSCLIVRGLMKDMCRYCGKENAPTLCEMCKRAKYCNKVCQIRDWKEYDHKLICFRPAEETEKPSEKEETE